MVSRHFRRVSIIIIAYYIAIWRKKGGGQLELYHDLMHRIIRLDSLTHSWNGHYLSGKDVGMHTKRA